MKKFLALSLALLMMAASLAACNKKNNKVLSDDEDEGYVSTTQKPSDTTTPDDKDPDAPTTQTGTWVEQVDTVYAGVDKLHLRTSDNKDSNNNIAKTIDWGTKLNRTETNGKWSKVTLDGDSQTYYVSNTWISANAGHFNIVACEPVTLEIKDTSNNILFFESPFECNDSELYYDNVICASGFKLSNIDGAYTLKKTGVSSSGSWVRVEFVGTIKISDKTSATFTETAPGELYVKILAFNRGDIDDPTYVKPGTSTGGRG